MNPATSVGTPTPRLFTLEGSLRGYDWGDTTTIASLLGIAHEGPLAEYWMGAHPSGPSRVVESDTTLDLLIARKPAHNLGVNPGGDRHELPFLLKVLAAAQPLSIQAHPSAEQARLGFAQENAKGIALDAPDRVFRDPNDKPELLVAVTEFAARVGFRPLDDALAVLDSIAQNDEPQWERAGGHELRQLLTADGFLGALGWLVSRPKETQLLLSSAAVAAAGRLDHHDAEALRSANTFHPGDLGGVVLMLLNAVSLHPGDAILLDAGTLHAYLHGVGIEIMANSDNVVRGGLTTKHVSPDLLLKTVTADPKPAAIQHRNAAVCRYDTGLADFSLVTVEAASYVGETRVPRIVFVSSGTAQVTAADETKPMTSGSAVFVPAQTAPVRVEADGVAWIAEGR